MRLTIEEIVEAVDGKCLNKCDERYIQEVTTDSRSIVENGLFIPLKGERFDGHHFISQVHAHGVVATLTMKQEIIDERLCTIYVEDTAKALLDLSHYYRMKFTLPVVGITGSVGKTSTKEMVTAVLSGKWLTHKTEGNFNNEIGMPLTLLKLESCHEVAVIEMGMNHFGEIHRLSTTARPNVAIITNIGTSHIENLGSREGILKAKLEVLDGLQTGGLLIINGDNDLLKQLHDLPYKMVSYGLSKENDYWAHSIKNDGEYTLAYVVTPKEEYPIRIKALGEHMVYNTLAAIAVAEHLGLTLEEIERGLSYYEPTKMRMQLATYENGITVIDDTYNASVDSMKAALKVLKDYKTQGRKIAVLGDMLELGDFAPVLHEEVGAFAASLELDGIYAVGALAKHIEVGCQKKGYSNVYHYDTKASFVEEMGKQLVGGDTILFKASRGMHFEEMLEEVRKVK